MPQYQQPEKQRAVTLSSQAEANCTAGVKAGANSDNYILITVHLVPGRHRQPLAYQRLRYTTSGVGTAIPIAALILLALSPKPPWAIATGWV